MRFPSIVEIGPDLSFSLITLFLHCFKPTWTQHQGEKKPISDILFFLFFCLSCLQCIFNCPCCITAGIHSHLCKLVQKKAIWLFCREAKWRYMDTCSRAYILLWSWRRYVCHLQCTILTFFIFTRDNCCIWSEKVRKRLMVYS